MGFRNPVTNLSASQITPGTFPPDVFLAAQQIAGGVLPDDVIAAALADGAVTSSKLGPSAVTAPAIAAGAVVAGAIAANAIDGKTITGAVLRTAAAGNRVVVRDNAGVGTVEFFGAGGAQASRIEASVTTDPSPNDGLSIVCSNNAGALTPPRLTLEIGGASNGLINLSADQIDFAAPKVFVGGNDLARATLEAAGSRAMTTTIAEVCAVDLPAGRWKVTGTGFADWATGVSAPRFQIFLWDNVSGPRQQVDVAIGQLAGSVPFSLGMTMLGGIRIGIVGALNPSGSGGTQQLANCRIVATPIG